MTYTVAVIDVHRIRTHRTELARVSRGQAREARQLRALCGSMDHWSSTDLAGW